MAYASGLTDSSVATAIYTILAAAPTFSPSGGTYTAAQTVTLSSTHPGRHPHTTDGSAPNETAERSTRRIRHQRHDHREGHGLCQRLTDSSVATAIYTILAALQPLAVRRDVHRGADGDAEQHHNGRDDPLHHRRSAPTKPRERL